MNKLILATLIPVPDSRSFGDWHVKCGPGVLTDESDQYFVASVGSLFVKDTPFGLSTAEQALDNKTTDIDGAGWAVVVDKVGKRIGFVSDILGFYPAFHTKCHQAWSNNPDTIASLVGAELNCKALTEFLVYGSILGHETYYEDVYRCKSGTITIFDYVGKINENISYFFPDLYANRPANASRDWYAEFLAGLDKAIARVGQKNICLLLSAGLDSSLIAQRLQKFNVTAVTMSDSDNLEVQGARRTAKKCGFEHIVLYRDEDYYFNNLERTIELTYGMFEYRHAYTAGLTEQIRQSIGFRPVITGCYFDLFFKGISIKPDARWYDREVPFSSAHSDQVRERRESLTNNAPNLKALELLRITPMSNVKTLAFRTSLAHTLNFNLLTAHRDLVKLALEMPTELKNPLFSNRPNKISSSATWRRLDKFAGKLKRGLVRRGKRLLFMPADADRESGWVPIEKIKTDPQTKTLMDDRAEEITFLRKKLGITNYNAPEVQTNDRFFFRVVTLAEWVRQNQLHIKASNRSGESTSIPVEGHYAERKHLAQGS